MEGNRYQVAGDGKNDGNLPPVTCHLSPLTRRRLSLFRANRRGYWSLWIFLLLFFLSLFAELIANDKPILLRYQGAFYFPVVATYSEKTFGGDFDTEAVYRDAFVRQRIESEGGWMLWPPIRYSYSTINYDLGRPAPSPPTRENWLGTDDQGRDVLARLIYGFRLSVCFGLLLTSFSAVFGIMAGAVQGFFGGWIDLAFQRFIEIWSGLPELFLLIILASLITPNFWWLLAILLLFTWMSLAGVVRAEFLRARNFDYVKAARALGVSELRIMVRHVLPNALVSAMTVIPFMMSGAVAALTTLDFLGFGLPPGSASLGELLLQGKNNLQAPWLGFAGFMVISLLLVLIIFISEAVRDAFDPRKELMR
jgi:microcin C transport system permease protein